MRCRCLDKCGCKGPAKGGEGLADGRALGDETPDALSDPVSLTRGGWRLGILPHSVDGVSEVVEVLVWSGFPSGGMDGVALGMQLQ